MDKSDEPRQVLIGCSPNDTLSIGSGLPLLQPRWGGGEGVEPPSLIWKYSAMNQPYVQPQPRDVELRFCVNRLLVCPVIKNYRA